LLIAPLPAQWELPSLIAFWVSVALTLISGAIYLLPQKTTEESQVVVK
ncbi:MAG: CDP-diacylglycerol--glycerol-3-phosphate 3-phosphatidyltransferase, partial [Richelia sp. SL_2_1]|nr:CDP-diacylglycerol--glycerol-3-phosphate 3-phosphatidyltransferase [Richelia sp. SL_2_1]